jgi:pimeloyl-ACP methyl ester carboxylesterase
MPTIKLISEGVEEPAADIVFIHGLWGDAQETWEFTDPEYGDKTYWPGELADEFKKAAVWSVGYDSSPTKWVGNNMPLLDRATSILDLLDANGIGSRPLIFITHSLGGLLTKAMLRASHDTPPEHDKHQLYRNTRGVVFFSTPHTGSSLGQLSKAIPGGRPTEILTELSQNDAYLRNLAQWFSDHGKQFDYKCLTYFEAYPTKKFTVVDATSANPNLGMQPVPFDGDHFSICKIPSREDQRFKQVAKFVTKILAEAEPQESQFVEEATIENVDFEIGVIPNPPQDGRVIEHHPPARILTYVSRTSKDSISIVPKMHYLEHIAKGGVIDPIAFFWNPFRCQFPSLDVVLINNTGKTLVLSGATLEVASSRPDFSPVIVIPSNTHGMKLEIQNQGWGKISNAVLRCNLHPTSMQGYMPDPPIDDIEIGKDFSLEFQLGDFAENCELDLRDAIGKAGVDLESISNAPRRSQMMYAMQAMQTGGDVKHAKHMGRFPNMQDDSAWAPFPDGYVVVAGRLEFDSVNQAGVPERFTLPVRARVFMFDPRFDQPMPPSYQYSAELEHTGLNYEVPIKVCQSLKAGEADRFTIRLACSQSAFHELKICWNFVGGLTSRSPLIRLQHFVPRTFADERSEAAENSEFDPELSDVRTVFDGDCIEQSLMMAMNVAQLRAQEQQPPE